MTAPETNTSLPSNTTNESGVYGRPSWRVSIRHAHDPAPRTTRDCYYRNEDEAHGAAERLRRNEHTEIAIHYLDRHSEWRFVSGWRLHGDGRVEIVGPEVHSPYYGCWDGADWGWTI